MANPEHVDKLIEGVEAWNAWRYVNPEIVPAFWGAALEETDLRLSNLKDADLEEADLSNADLREANLNGAKLRAAALQGANLRGAYFARTNLKRANLYGADLRAAIYLRVEQLCEAKTLCQTELDPDLESEARRECPRLFEKSAENADQ